ncbi:hypothetical protein F5884DRAFT_304652 [Xylogone sp. PMI_703]|nr:hypothetical protein F5884DRAFT_304652 [Xylogone sp. PMI_703]
MPGDSVEQKNSKGVEFDETTKQTHKTTPLKASTPPEETPPGRSTQPEQAQPTTRPETSVINQRLEVYLIKGDRDEKYLLKLALRQEELKKQMNAVLSRTQSPIWDTLISLTPKEQANVHYVLEYSKKQDNIDPVLVAIEVRKAEVALVSPEPQQILLFLSKEAGNIGAQPLDREQQTYTRMSRRYLSIETLNRYRIPYEFDIDPNYILIKRWVPEYEQDFLWDHTRKARERREEPIVLAIDSSKKEHHHRHHLEPEFEFVRKTKHHHQKHTSKPNPSPLLKFLSGKSTHGKDTPKIDEERDTVVDQEKVDDLLAKYTTVYKENEQSGKNVETEKLKNQREKDTSAEISSNEEDRLGEEFLRSTNLDDYFSDDEQSVSSSSVSTRKSRFMRRLRKLWPFSGPRIRFRRKRGSGSSWSSSGSLSSAS